MADKGPIALQWLIGSTRSDEFRRVFEEYRPIYIWRVLTDLRKLYQNVCALKLRQGMLSRVYSPIDVEATDPYLPSVDRIPLEKDVRQRHSNTGRSSIVKSRRGIGRRCDTRCTMTIANPSHPIWRQQKVGHLQAPKSCSNPKKALDVTEWQTYARPTLLSPEQYRRGEVRKLMPSPPG